MRESKKNNGYVSRHAAAEVSEAEENAELYEKPRKTKKEKPPKEKKVKKSKRPELSEEELELRAAAKRERKRKREITFTIIGIILVLLASALTFGGYYVSNNGLTVPNVYVDGVAVGNMTQQAAVEAIKASGWEERAAQPLVVKLFDAAEFDIEQYKSGAMQTPEEAAARAFAYGHGSNWYKNLFLYAKGYIVPVELNDIELELDSEYIQAQCKLGVEELNKALGDGGYEVDKETSVLRMTKGAGDLSFDYDDMTAAISTALRAGKTELSYTQLAAQPKAPDFQAIFDELSAEPADAYYTDDNTFTVVDDVEGCDFSVDDAARIWQGAEVASVVEIPVKLTFPEITGDELRARLFRDTLGSMTTYFPNSSDDRINNIKLAASKINDMILYPGDVFSYNDSIGQRTEEVGFRMAGAYSNGEVVQELGGGICQVSSTLYSAMLYSYHLTTVQRSPHYFPVDYLEMGYDATVSWPKPDFKFRNDRDYPVKIVATVNDVDRYITIDIMGTNLDGTYIELKKDTYSYNNDRYPWIMEGYGVQMHRLVYDANGMQIDQIDEIYDVYHTHEATDQIKALDAQAAAAGAEGMEMPA